MQPITDLNALTIDHSRTTQLYWDTQDPDNEGWALRYWTVDGVQHSVDLDDDEEASIERLAYQVRREVGPDLILRAPWRIEVHGRGGHRLGSITINPSKGRVSLRSELGWERA